MAIGQRNNDLHFIGLNDVNGTGMRWRGSTKTTNDQADFGVTKDNAWHHYVLVASRSTLTLYVDGELFGSAADKQTQFIISYPSVPSRL